MNNLEHGGPAFPSPAYAYSNGEINPGEGGMTLRQYAAIKAMQGFIASDTDYVMSAKGIAKFSVEHADALLAELEAK
jgi:hypothetical protein